LHVLTGESSCTCLLKFAWRQLQLKDLKLSLIAGSTMVLKLLVRPNHSLSLLHLVVEGLGGKELESNR